jgi:RNA-directed DNA polymerase
VSVPPPHLFRRHAIALGRDPRTAERTLEIYEALSERGVYPVYTLGHLAQLTGAPWSYLRDVVSRRRDPYLDIERPKRDGTTRAISSPEPVLMDVQRWVLHNILPACSVHPSSYAYQRNRSIVDCARLHLGARWLVKLDLHDFFETIHERRVYRIFRGLGYSRLLSLELTRLCTRAGPSELVRRDRDAYQGKAPYRVEPEGSLPQGAPTSGLLANAVAMRVDSRLSKLARGRGLVYTRYSDDIVLSASDGFSRQDASELVRQVSSVLGSEGFAAHRSKTRIVPPGARRVILGLLVDGEQVHLLPEFKRRLQIHVRGVSKFGLAEHAYHRRFTSILSLIEHVDGCIAFAASVDSAFAVKMQSVWNETLSAAGYPKRSGSCDSLH